MKKLESKLFHKVTFLTLYYSDAEFSILIGLIVTASNFYSTRKEFVISLQHNDLCAFLKNLFSLFYKKNKNKTGLKGFLCPDLKIGKIQPRIIFFYQSENSPSHVLLTRLVYISYSDLTLRTSAAKHQVSSVTFYILLWKKCSCFLYICSGYIFTNQLLNVRLIFHGRACVVLFVFSLRPASSILLNLFCPIKQCRLD